MALAKLKQVAVERDAAVKEMREMADQCKSIANEFETMAVQYEKILKGNPIYFTIKIQWDLEINWFCWYHKLVLYRRVYCVLNLKDDLCHCIYREG